MSTIQAISIGCFGALCVELLYLYERRGRFGRKKIPLFLKSVWYWVLTIAFVIISGIVAWMFNTDNLTTKTLFISGIGARSIIKNIMTSGSVNTNMTLGDDEITIKDILL